MNRNYLAVVSYQEGTGTPPRTKMIRFRAHEQNMGHATLSGAVEALNHLNHLWNPSHRYPKYADIFEEPPALSPEIFSPIGRLHRYTLNEKYRGLDYDNYRWMTESSYEQWQADLIERIEGS